MNPRRDVTVFLSAFKTKMKIWDVLFRDDRGKNAQALLDLEIRPVDRKKILERLELEDYCDGPMEEKMYAGADMWIFGKVVKNKEVYIKITMGVASSVFHFMWQSMRWITH